MLFKLFPSIVYKTSGPNVTDLPVEVSATILRYLDPQSLYNAAKVNKKWAKVCVGDPTLRRRLRTEITEKKHRMVEVLLNPGMGVVVKRTQEGNVYGVNVVKTTNKRKFQYDFEENFDFVQVKKAKIFNSGVQMKTKRVYRKLTNKLRL